MKNINYNRLKNRNKKGILTACIGQCVHVSGVYNFINIASQVGYECKFLGPATPISKLINEIQNYNPDIVGLSYRLTPLTVIPLLKNFFKHLEKIENIKESITKISFAKQNKAENDILTNSFKIWFNNAILGEYFERRSN